MSQELAKGELLLSKKGKPFVNVIGAESAMRAKKLDPMRHTVVEHPDGGYAIKKISTAGEVPVGLTPQGNEVQSGAEASTKEKYYRVRFHAKSNPNDMDNVTLGVNGEVLVIRREDEVVIPGRFVECARHATYPQFTQLPNEPRKMTGKIMTFPFDMLGEATEQEYLSMKQEGAKMAKEALEKASI